MYSQCDKLVNTKENENEPYKVTPTFEGKNICISFPSWNHLLVSFSYRLIKGFQFNKQTCIYIFFSRIRNKMHNSICRREECFTNRWHISHISGRENLREGPGSEACMTEVKDE